MARWTERVPPVITAISADEIPRLQALLTDPSTPDAANVSYNGSSALHFAQYNVEAIRLLLQHDANPFTRDFLNRASREFYEDALERDARSSIFIKPDTRQKITQIVELLKTAEEKWLNTHPGADVAPPPPPGSLAELLADTQTGPAATPGITG